MKVARAERSQRSNQSVMEPWISSRKILGMEPIVKTYFAATDCFVNFNKLITDLRQHLNDFTLSNVEMAGENSSGLQVRASKFCSNL